ncbi:MAG: deoxynucleoside kinase [Oscillospiraceae bacterium]|nr:deoxynucleoside kinase [Oscillospiraceae bacterium]
MADGKIIVLDGLDGCGKTTQFELLRDKLNEMNVPMQAVSFPEYDKPSAALVKMYLGGDFAASPDGVNAYAASSFYAVERYASYKLYWEKSYTEGKLILASRYTTSNAIHQMSKLPKEKWDEYLSWLEEYEYEKLGLPRPDCVIFLSLPLEISQKLLSERYEGDDEKKDIHEADLKYLTECRKSAEYAAEKLGWHVIDCSENGEIRSIESIHKELMRIYEEVNR